MHWPIDGSQQQSIRWWERFRLGGGGAAEPPVSFTRANANRNLSIGAIQIP